MRPPRCALPLVVLVLVGCGASDPGGSLYVNLGCQRCHGARGDGSTQAPELRGLGEHWSTDDALVEFLKDPPSATAGNPRLEALANRYPIQMVAVRGVRDEDLLILASWLRSRKGTG